MSKVQSPSKEELSRRSRISRGRGRRFEDQVVKRLEQLGYKTKKKLLSGSYLKKPYDIVVQPYRLKIEAKRTLKDAIVIQGDWLDRIKPKLIVVFAIGTYKGRQPIEMFVICEHDDLLLKGCTEAEGPTPTKELNVKKSKTIRREDVDIWGTLIYHDNDTSKLFRFSTLENYMKTHYPLTKEQPDGTTAGTDPVRSSV